MHSARKITKVTETDPRSVLQAIGSSSGFDLSQSTFETDEAGLVREVAVAASTQPHADSDVISLRINPDSNPINATRPSLLDSPLESASQIQQLAARLEANANDLQQRESQLEKRMIAWQQATAEQQGEFEKRMHQLEQQASQVRCQQLHLMQLQTDIVKSHDATKVAVESLVLANDSDEETLAALTTLKYQLSGRFDYIARRWEHLAELMLDIRTRIVANRAVDDAVDWRAD